MGVNPCFGRQQAQEQLQARPPFVIGGASGVEAEDFRAGADPGSGWTGLDFDDTVVGDVLRSAKTDLKLLWRKNH